MPENGATSLGSGVLIDVRDDFGLVITNWHVVRDATGPVEVIMPGGFTSKARPLKVDSDWDLAALVIWRPPAEPVTIATRAPQPGDQLTICGYGPGIYRAATGRCTQYYAPRADLPQHMVELDVQARQGDSGGPIFNDRGELAGVLFGAGEGTTLGSFGGRVENFLASLAPDIGGAQDSREAAEPRFALTASTHGAAPAEPAASVAVASQATTTTPSPPQRQATATLSAASAAAASAPAAPTADVARGAEPTWAPAPAGAASPSADNSPAIWPQAPTRDGWLDTVKSLLAAVGVIAIAVQLLKLAR